MNVMCDMCHKITDCKWKIELDDSIFGRMFKLCGECGTILENIIRETRSR